MNVEVFLASFGSEEPLARVLYYYLKKKNLLKEMREDIKDKKIWEFFEKQDLFLEKDIKEFTQGDNFFMFERIKSFIVNQEK